MIDENIYINKITLIYKKFILNDIYSNLIELFIKTKNDLLLI